MAVFVCWVALNDKAATTGIAGFRRPITLVVQAVIGYVCGGGGA